VKSGTIRSRLRDKRAQPPPRSGVSVVAAFASFAGTWRQSNGDGPKGQAGEAVLM